MKEEKRPRRKGGTAQETRPIVALFGVGYTPRALAAAAGQAAAALGALYAATFACCALIAW